MRGAQYLILVAIVVGACSNQRNGDGAETGAGLGETAAGDAGAAENTANLDVWLETMEVGSRELYSARSEVMDAVGLEPGDRIADIGAGTGLYSLLFAAAVGKEGVVYAVDIEPRFLKLINQRAEDLDIANVVSVLGRENSITLPEASVDYVFISDTYNYFEYPEEIMKTAFDALKPGGVLFVLDFDLPEEDARSIGLQHVRVGKEAAANEISTLGFRSTGEIDVPGLEETYMIKFIRP